MGVKWNGLKVGKDVGSGGTCARHAVQVQALKFQEVDVRNAIMLVCKKKKHVGMCASGCLAGSAYLQPQKVRDLMAMLSLDRVYSHFTFPRLLPLCFSPGEENFHVGIRF